MPKRDNKIPSAGDKKRKEVSVAANDESGPTKKRVRKRCSVDDCTNIAKKGGVCLRHGSGPRKKKDRYECSADGCGNWRVEGGVCFRHGARVKICNVGNCTNQSKKGGVCKRHGAKVEHKRCSVGNCTNQSQNGGVCIRHGAKVKRKLCSVDGCTNQRYRRGVCWRHRFHSVIAPRAQGNFLCGDVQGEGNQNNASTVVEVSDNEGEGGKKQSPIAGRKRKADNVGKKAETATSNDAGGDGPGEFVQEAPGNKDAVVDGQNAKSDESSFGVANLKDDNEQDTSDMRPQKRVRGEGNLKDGNEQDASDVAPTQGGSEEGTGDAMEDGGSCGGNEYDCGGDDNGDDNGNVNSEEGEHSHVVPDEIVTTGVYDNEKENEVLTLTSKLEKANNRNQRLATELKDANNTVITLTEQLKDMSTELEVVKSRSKSEHERAELLRSHLNGVEAQIDEKNDIIAELVEELEAEKVKKAEMDTQLMTTATARLEERVAKNAANAKLWEMTKKFEAATLRFKTWWKSKLNDKETQLKAKSDAVVKLKAEVGKVQAAKDEIQAQLQIATENEVVLRSKVEELTKEFKEVTTKFEAAESFWNSRREEKKIYAELNRTKSQLRAKSDALAESKKEGSELLELNASLRNQLEKQSKGGSEVKEEELTDDEDITARLKERRMAANEQMKVMTAKVDFAVLEVGKRDVELEQAKAENEELRRALNEERRQKRFKVKYSPRMKQQERDKRR